MAAAIHHRSAGRALIKIQLADLSYHVTLDCKLYGGGRWINYANPSFSTSMGYVTFYLTDRCLLELGARYKL